MGKRGPKATPTAVLERRGSWLAKVRAKSEPVKLSDPPAMPAKMPPLAVEAWNFYEPLLQKWGVLSTVDGLALERLCMLYYDLKTYEAQIEKRGRFQTMATGESKIAPWTRLYHQTHDQFVRMLHEFGLSPATHKDVSPDGDGEVSDAAKFFND